MLRLVVVNTILHVSSEVSNESLHRPRGGVTQSTDSVTFDLVGQLFEHVDLSEVGVSEFHTLQHIDHPASALAARGALTAGLVLVELGETQDSVDHIGLVVHHDDGSCSQAGLAVLKIVKVHESILALSPGQHGHGRTTGNDGLEVVPATDDALAVALDELTKRDGHLLLDGDGVVDMATDAEELGAGVSLTTEASEPGGTASHDRWNNGHRLNIGHGGRAPIETGVSREWGL